MLRHPSDRPDHRSCQTDRIDRPRPAVVGPRTDAVDRYETPSRAIDGEIAYHLAALVSEVRRIADALDPPKSDLVDTPYVATRLGCTTTWIAELARKGAIPLACVVPGTGDGKPWKFYRSRIDEWIDSR